LQKFNKEAEKIILLSGLIAPNFIRFEFPGITPWYAFYLTFRKKEILPFFCLK